MGTEPRTPPSPTTPRPGAPRFLLGRRQVRAASVDPDIAIPSVTPSPCSLQGCGAVHARHGRLRRRRQGAPPRAPQPAPHQDRHHPRLLRGLLSIAAEESGAPRWEAGGPRRRPPRRGRGGDGCGGREEGGNGEDGLELLGPLSLGSWRCRIRCRGRGARRIRARRLVGERSISSSGVWARW